MDNFSHFTRLYGLQKTLRFELQPIGKTAEHIKNNRLLENDEKRADDYETVKEIIDGYHKWFVDKVLKILSLATIKRNRLTWC